jgi:hypothetical protein
MSEIARLGPERPESGRTIPQRVEAIEQALGRLRSEVSNFRAYERRGGSINDAVEGIVAAVEDALREFRDQY